MENVKNSMQVSLVQTFNSIQDKANDILKNEKLDIKQISDLERYVGMSSVIMTTLHTLKGVVKD